MLFRSLIDKHNPKNQNNYCYDYTFNGIKHYINKADLACANMEFTLAGYPFTGYPQFSAPDKIAVTAKESGINVFLTANNHILDKGLKGLKRTLNIYDSLGVYYTGSYRDSLHELKNNPLIIEKNNIKIGLINFTYGTNGIKVSPPSIVSFMDSTKVKNAIKKAKDLAVDIIIATPHWGEEYHLTQSKIGRAHV